MSLAVRPADDGTGIYDYQVFAKQREQMASNEADEASRLPTADDLFKLHEKEANRSLDPIHHRGAEDSPKKSGRHRMTRKEARAAKKEARKRPE